jgi:energy-converting hydrogenase Eha subunit E
MILTSIFLFGKLRQPLIIWLTVPLAIVGVSVGLLSTGGAFDFMSLLGALSLIGLLIKNAIVLIEEIDQQIESGKDSYDGHIGLGRITSATRDTRGGHDDPGPDSAALRRLLCEYVSDHHGGAGIRVAADADYCADALCAAVSHSS